MQSTICARVHDVCEFIGSTRLLADFTALSDIFSFDGRSTCCKCSVFIAYASVSWCSRQPGPSPLAGNRRSAAPPILPAALAMSLRPAKCARTPHAASASSSHISQNW